MCPFLLHVPGTLLASGKRCVLDAVAETCRRRKGVCLSPTRFGRSSHVAGAKVDRFAAPTASGSGAVSPIPPRGLWRNVEASRVSSGELKERNGGMIVAASTVAIVAIAAVVIVALLAFVYVVPRGGRKRRPKL